MNLPSRLLPDTAIFSALTTTTKSPVSRCGANVGLCLPRSRVAAWTASRPSTTSLASMTCHVRVISLGLGLYVDTDLPLCFSTARLWCAGAGPGATAAHRRERPRAAHRSTRVPAGSAAYETTPVGLARPRGPAQVHRTATAPPGC